MAFSSAQISQMVGGQMTMFSNQATYAHQIGAQFGGMPQAQPQMMNSPSFAMPGYGGQDYGIGYSHTAGGLGAAAVGGIGGALPSAIGMGTMAAGFGLFGHAAGYADPFVGTARMFARGAGIGGQGFFGGLGALGSTFASRGIGAGLGAVGGGLAAAALPMAGYMAIGAGIQNVASNIYAGAQDVSQVGAMTNQYFGPAYGTQGARPGGMFSRGTVQAITGVLQEMAGQDTMASMESLKRLMDQAGRAGMLTGITDADQFKRRFKGLVDQLKSVAMVMGTSLEEAAPLFGQMRQMGIWRASDILGTAGAAKLVGPQATPQMMQSMQQAAQTSWAMGGTMRAGALLGREQFINANAMIRGGMLTEEQLMEYTGGVGGTQGQMMLGGRITQIAQNVTQAPIGRLAMAGLGEVVGGRFTGNVDKKALDRFLAGGMSIDDLQRRGQGATNTREGAASWTYQQDILGQNLMQQGGTELLASMIQTGLKKAGFGDASKDIQGIMIQHLYGLGRRDARMIQKIMDDLPAMLDKRASSTRQALEDGFREADERKNRSWQGFKDALDNVYEREYELPIKRYASLVSTRLNETIDQVSNQLWGRVPPVQISERERSLAITRGVTGTGALNQLLTERGMTLGGGASLEEKLRTPMIERLGRSTGLLSGLLTPEGSRASMLGDLMATTSRYDGPIGSDTPQSVRNLGRKTADEIVLSSGLYGTQNVATKGAVEENLRAIQAWSGESFGITDVLQGEKTQLTGLMKDIESQYGAWVKTNPNVMRTIRDLRESGEPPHKIMAKLKELAYSKDPRFSDPNLRASLEKAMGMSGGKDRDATLNSLFALAEKGTRAAKYDPAAIGGGLSLEGVLRDPKEHGKFLDQLARESFEASSRVKESYLVDAVAGGAILTAARTPLGIPAMVIGAIAGYGYEDLTKTVGKGLELAGIIGGDLSEAETAEVYRGSLSGDLATALSTGTVSKALADELDKPDSPVTKYYEKWGPKSTQVTDEERKKEIARINAPGAIKGLKVVEETLNAQASIARRELSSLGDVKGLGKEHRQQLEKILRDITEADEGLGPLVGEERIRQLRGRHVTSWGRMEQLARSLSPEQAKKFRESGGSYMGQIGAMAGLYGLKDKRTGDISRSEFEDLIAKQVSSGAGYSVLETLKRDMPEKYEEIEQFFTNQAGGAGVMTQQEFTRATSTLEALSPGLIGGSRVQERRSEKEEQNAKLMDQLRIYTDTNTRFVLAVNEALEGQIGAAARALISRGEWIDNQSGAGGER